MYGGDIAGIVGVLAYLGTLILWFRSTEGR